jgi:hypothetical protein
MKTSEVIKECRAAAKAAGLTFKRKNMTINNAPAYCFVDRRIGIVKLDNCTLSNAYDNVCSGYIESYDAERGQFAGVNHYK